jgi:hypothetical protein
VRSKWSGAIMKVQPALGTPWCCCQAWRVRRFRCATQSCTACTRAASIPSWPDKQNCNRIAYAVSAALEHDWPGHVENKKRVSAVVDSLHKFSLTSHPRVEHLQFQDAEPGTIKLVHQASYVDMLKVVTAKHVRQLFNFSVHSPLEILDLFDHRVSFKSQQCSNNQINYHIRVNIQ